MADDLSLDAFVGTLRRSRLFDDADIGRIAARLRSTTARDLADALIRVGELTHYQAEKLLRGRWQGLVIGPYSVLAPLGRGGMGTVVYLARDRRMAESLGDSVLVALKLLPHRKAVAEPRVLARFRREMEFGRRVNHPNVVRTFAAGDLDQVHYLALEFIPGKTLRQLVVGDGPLPVGSAARTLADVASGLAHLHERGLVHRDVKPSNVMVHPGGRAVVLDLGLAFDPGEPLPEDPAVVGGRGYVVGTMDYLAPEQAKNAVGVGPSADIYSLGCTLYFALTGTPPFPAWGVHEKVRRHRDDPPPLVPNAPPEFARLVQRLMAKSPKERPASAREVRELLLPWATLAHREGKAVDAVAAADEPGLDAGLWEATPGEELPEPEEGPSSNSFARLDEASGSNGQAKRYAAATVDPAGLMLLGLLLFLFALIVIIALIRRL